MAKPVYSVSLRVGPYMEEERLVSHSGSLTPHPVSTKQETALTLTPSLEADEKRGTSPRPPYRKCILLPITWLAAQHNNN
jgi:hypothetical protein